MPQIKIVNTLACKSLPMYLENWKWQSKTGSAEGTVKESVSPINRGNG
jgi:hypothetical protein